MHIMKPLIAWLFLLSFFSIQESYSQKLRELNQKAFKEGEVLSFRVHYGFIDAGEAIVEIKETKTLGVRRVYHIIGTGRTISAFDWFFKVRDKYETYLDSSSIIPWLFIRRVDEGGYLINQDMVFNQHKKTVNSNGKQFDVPDHVQDMLSAFYFARTLDFQAAIGGQVFELPSFIDNEIWTLKIKFIRRETIKTDLGTFKCLLFRPIIQRGRIFKNEEDMNVWITDDENKIPVRGEAKIIVGSLKIDLKDYVNLANPISRIK